ncbi:NUDIX hydrolase [Nocardia thailandica]|uniref:NUDIX hydrolase n=1 Tax=Nocardia thailandica TaxID=257275 RepID=A0ABW6PLL2_9NOCA|nr:NUDIX hydrolase [Nocardia thailandica]
MIDESVFSNLRIDAERDEVRRLVVGAVVEREGRILILRRRRSEFLGGQWELPSGEVERGERLDEALIREVAEETGLEVTGITDYLGEFDYLSGSGTRTRQFTFAVSVGPGAHRVSAEHDAATWVPRSAEPPVSDAVREILAVHERRRSLADWSHYSLGSGA